MTEKNIEIVTPSSSNNKIENHLKLAMTTSDSPENLIKKKNQHALSATKLSFLSSNPSSDLNASSYLNCANQDLLSSKNHSFTKREIHSLQSSNDYPSFMNAKFLIKNEIDRLTHFYNQLDAHLKGEYDFAQLTNRALKFKKEVHLYVYDILLSIYEDFIKTKHEFTLKMKIEILEQIKPILKDYINELIPIVEYNRDDGCNRYGVFVRCKPSEKIKIYDSKIKENGDIEMKNLSVSFYTTLDQLYILDSADEFYDIESTDSMREQMINDNNLNEKQNQQKQHLFIKDYRGDIFKNLTIQIPMPVYEKYMGTDLFVFMDLKNMIELTRFVR